MLTFSYVTTMTVAKCELSCASEREKYEEVLVVRGGNMREVVS
jgi:hypothetical protein